MKVCHVCNGHRVDDGRVFHRACCELAAAGYEVHLFAIGKGSAPYEDKGVIVHPLPEAAGRRERFTRATNIARMAAAVKPDLFHVHEPDLLGPVLSRAGQRPVIYDVHESYLDILDESGWIPRWAKPIVRFAWDHRERRLLRRCAGVVTVTDPIADRYRRLHDRVSVVANYPDFGPIEALPHVERNAATCVVAGALTPDRGLSVILKGLAILKARGLTVKLALAGFTGTSGYLESLWEEAQALGVREQVHYHGVLSKSDALLFQQQAGIGLVTYQPLQSCISGLPNKLLECMGLGLPVIYSKFPKYREVAEAAGAGIMVDPTSPHEIADAIELLIIDPARARVMGEAGRRAVRERFNWQIEKTKLLRLYQEILGAPDMDTEGASLAAWAG